MLIITIVLKMLRLFLIKFWCSVKAHGLAVSPLDHVCSTALYWCTHGSAEEHPEVVFKAGFNSI